MTFRSRTLREMWRRRRTPASVAFGLLTAITVVAVVTAQSDLTTPSPAHGSTQVISQGMTARPDLKSTWRVVSREIPVRAEARPSNRLEGSAGFLLADDDPIFVTDQETKLRYRLASGEALFVPIGANQTWASLNDAPATAYTIELAVRDNVDETGGGELLFKGGTFGMAEGDYDLDLLRNTLPLNEHTQIDLTDFPVLLFVTAGQIEVISDKEGVDTVRINAGEGASLNGNLDIRARGDSATFVAAVIGASVGGGRVSTKPTATATAEPTATPEPEPTGEPESEPEAEPTRVPEVRTGTAQVRLYIRICPSGMRPETLDASRCTKAKGGFNLWLANPYGDPLRLRDANRLEDDYIRWDNLKAGDYTLLVRDIPNGYDISSLDGYLCCRTSDGYSLVLEKGAQIYGTLYFFRPE